MNTTLTIRIDKEIEQLLQELSRRSGQSKSELVRQAFKRQLTIDSFQQLRKELLPYEEVQMSGMKMVGGYWNRQLGLKPIY